MIDEGHRKEVPEVEPYDAMHSLSNVGPIPSVRHAAEPEL